MYDGDKNAMTYRKACRDAEAGQTLSALAQLEAALKISDNTAWYPLYAFCIAKERGHVKRAYELCRMALEADPHNPLHYYYLARVHLVAKSPSQAIAALESGVLAGGCPEIAALLNQLGTRKPLVFKKLKRDNPLNKYAGLILARLRLR